MAAATGSHLGTAAAIVLRLLAHGPQPRARLILAAGRPTSAVAVALTTLQRRGHVARLRHGV